MLPRVVYKFHLKFSGNHVYQNIWQNLRLRQYQPRRGDIIIERCIRKDPEPRRGGIIPQIPSARELIISFDKFLKQTPEQIPSIFIANKSRLHDRECRGNNITPSGFSGFIASILLQQCHPFGVGFLVAAESVIQIRMTEPECSRK